MKKIFTIFLMLSSFASFAQIWYVGAKAGPTFSNYKTKTPWKEVANTGFTFGATAYRQVKTNFGFSVDLQYIQKGYYHKVCNSIYDKLEATYLEVPIMADYTFIIPHLRIGKVTQRLGYMARTGSVPNMKPLVTTRVTTPSILKKAMQVALISVRTSMEG